MSKVRVPSGWVLVGVLILLADGHLVAVSSHGRERRLSGVSSSEGVNPIRLGLYPYDLI